MGRSVFTVVALVLLVVGTSGLALGASQPSPIWFGAGGPMLGLLLPDLGEVDTFLVDAGFAQIAGPILAFGGGGRGGSVGGLSFGGMGWGGDTSSRLEDKKATLSYGFGGFDLGVVLGGNDRSFLTIGAVLGGGATDLELRQLLAGEESLCGASPCPRGIIVEPEGFDFGCAYVGLLPYVSLEVHPFAWIGFNVYFGYVLPILRFDWVSQAGVSVPPLDPSGPFIGFSIAFGGVAQEKRAESRANQTTQSTLTLGANAALAIHNKIGSITIASEVGSPAQTGSSRVVQLIAIKRASGQAVLDKISVDIVQSEAGVEVRSQGPDGFPGAWSVDYFVKVPAGLTLEIEQGVGDIVLSDFSGSLAVKLGVGEVQAERITATSVVVEIGAGDVKLLDLDSQKSVVNSGTGSIEVTLRLDASVTVAAATGIGSVTIAQFPGMQLALRGFLGHEADAVLGTGAASLTAKVGVGEIRIRPVTP